MISIAFDQISTDFSQSKEDIHNLSNYGGHLQSKLDYKFLVVVIVQKTQKRNTNIPRYCTASLYSWLLYDG